MSKNLLSGFVVLGILAMPAPGATPELRDFSGRLEVLVEDEPDPARSRTLYYLHANDGKRYRLRFDTEKTRDLRTGQAVTMRGAPSEDLLEVHSESLTVVVEESTRAVSNRTNVVLRVDFQDRTVGCTEQAIASTMYDGTYNVDALYQDTSFDAVAFPRDTDGDGQPDVFTVTIDAYGADPCNPDGWAAAADQAAASSGISLNQYQHKIYVLPQTVCTWAGRAHVGCGNSCRAWIDVCNLGDVYAHELGHNLSLRHSSSDIDNDDSIDNNYGDVSDFMGYGGYGWRQVNGPHKVEMGWIPASQVIEADQTGNYVLSPLETDPATAPYPQVIRVERPAQGDDLYLSYRRRIGYDIGLRTEYVDRTSIHSQDGPGYNTLFLQALADGEQFSDGPSGIDVLQVSHDDLSVTLQVTLQGSGCPDADGDGVCDADDICPGGDDNIDTDLDGVPDFCDACPSGDDSLDNDGDGLCDADDPDDDNDGTDDVSDCAPFHRGVTTPPGDIGATLLLRKGSGAVLTWDAGMQGPVSNVYRGVISYPWTDNESCSVAETVTRSANDADIPAAGSAFYYLIGARNICGESMGSRTPVAACSSSSLESDGDSIPDLADTCPADADASLVDTDGDFVGDVCDNCSSVVNSGQADRDVDGLGDDCDSCTDWDADGWGDPGFNNTCATDNCPLNPNPSQADSDGDGPGDACDDCPFDAEDDPDGDATCENEDNCPYLFNVDQIDTDLDGYGDACDACPTDPAKIDPGLCGCGNSEASCTCDWEAAPEHIVNGDFDLWSGGGPDNWSTDESGGSINQEQRPPRVFGGSGTSVRLDREGAGILRLSQSGLTLEPGRWYRLQWHGKADDPATTDLVWSLRNFTTSRFVASDGSAWTTAPLFHPWVAPLSWTAFDRWIYIDPTFASTDIYVFVLRWEDGLAGQSVYLDRISIEGPFDTICLN